MLQGDIMNLKKEWEFIKYSGKLPSNHVFWSSEKRWEYIEKLKKGEIKKQESKHKLTGMDWQMSIGLLACAVFGWIAAYKFIGAILNISPLWKFFIWFWLTMVCFGAVSIGLKVNKKISS